MITFVLPTHNRPEILRGTLAALGSLPVHDAALACREVIVADNASDPPLQLPRRLSNGLPVSTFRLQSNHAAAARNEAAARAGGDWLVMLDDDSYPEDLGFVDLLAAASPEVAAIGGDIRLPDGSREAGGLPEVFVGCGVAIRREAFIEVGGYDSTFGYYAEEYDLCARLIRDGWRIVHDLRFRVRHEKTASGRDKNLILQHLVRNNGWVFSRYCPESPSRHRAALIEEMVERYGRIARKENAEVGYYKGLRELFATVDQQPRRPLSKDLFDRFTGLSQVRDTLAGLPGGVRVAVVDEGKNAWVVEQVLTELDVARADDVRTADVVVLGTISPGPMMDALERRRKRGESVVAGWEPRGMLEADVGGAVARRKAI